MQLSILLLTLDRVSAEQLAGTLAVIGHGTTVVTRVEDLLEAAPRYSLVVLDVLPPESSAAEIVLALRADPGTDPVPVLAVAQSADLEARITLLEAGADDVITKPFAQTELEARVEALSFRVHGQAGTSRGTVIGGPGNHRVVAVYSPKGGAGSTTIATNLALLAAERRPGQTLLIDLDLAFGQVASHLNLQPRQTLLELVRDAAALQDPELFRTYAIHHESGLQIIVAPPGPGYASLITSEHLDLVVTRALEAYEFVVLDAGTSLDERQLALFGRVDKVIVPVLPEVPALNAVRLLLDQLAEMGTLGGSTLFVLNNAFARDLLKRSDVETVLGTRITADLPYDPIAYLKAVNEGVPVVIGAPKSLPAEHFRALADIVFGNGSGPQAPAPEIKEKRGLFGRRR